MNEVTEYLEINYNNDQELDHLSKFIGSVVSMEESIGKHNKDTVLRLIKNEVKKKKLSLKDALVAKQAIYLFCFNEHIEIKPKDCDIPDHLYIYK